MKANQTVITHPRRSALAGSIAAVCVALSLAWTEPAAAQSKGDVQISLLARKVTAAADGKEILIAADTARPGEVIQYDAVYSNTGKKEVRNLAPTLPIPAGMEFVAESAKPAATQASLDGRTFEAFPLVRKIKRPDGRVEEVPVPFSEYRALRWNAGELKAGATTRIIARARLQTNVAAR